MTTNRRARLGEHAFPIALTGVVLWLVAAFIVRAMPGLFENRWRTFLVMLAAIPIAEIVLMTVGAVIGVERSKRLGAAAVLSISVLGCHALTAVFWPGLLGSDETIVRHGGAFMAAVAAALIGAAWRAAERVR